MDLDQRCVILLGFFFRPFGPCGLIIYRQRGRNLPLGAKYCGLAAPYIYRGRNLGRNSLEVTHGTT